MKELENSYDNTLVKLRKKEQSTSERRVYESPTLTGLVNGKLKNACRRMKLRVIVNKTKAVVAGRLLL